MIRIVALLSVGLSLVVSAGIAGDTGSSAYAGQLLFTQIPIHEQGETPGSSSARHSADLPDGSRIVLFDLAAPGAGVTDLTPGFAAAGRPDLSFDGTRVLFVARRGSNEPLNVWEVGLDGASPRQITDRTEDTAQAIYLSALFTLNATMPEQRIAYCTDDGVKREPGVACAALYTCRLDGSQTRRITFNPYGVGDPHLLSDGRLLYVSARPPDSGGGTALFTVHPDGTDVSPFAAVHDPAANRGMPAETADGSVVFVESDLATPADGGSLIAVSRSRSLHGRRTIGGSDAGSYRSPRGLSDGRLLVSYRSGRDQTYGIQLLDPRGTHPPVDLFDAEDRHDVDALEVRPRRPPAGRSSVVGEDSEHGYLYCMNAYLSDRDAARKIAKGSIARLRVFEATPTGGTSLLAEVPVRDDGSFYLQLPARTALRLETIDAAGALLQSMENWIWVMPDEQRGCIGCHEDRERTPPNRHPQALRAQPQIIGRDSKP